MVATSRRFLVWWFYRKTGGACGGARAACNGMILCPADRPGERHETSPQNLFATGSWRAPAVSRIAKAQAYQSRPITMVVPFPPGGLTDVIARVLAEGMRTSLGQSIIIENVGGATGSIGTGQVARAALDGYTLVIGCSMAQESPWRFPQWMSSETEVGMFKSKAPALDLDHTVSESLPLLFDR